MFCEFRVIQYHLIVFQLMLELIKNKMSYLSGTAQKNVMVILEQIAMKSRLSKD